MHARPVRWTALAAMVAAMLFAAAITPVPAEAHAEYTRSNPPADGTVRAAPPRLDVWFTAELFRRAGENRLTVTDPGGRPVHAGDAVIDDADRKHMSVALMPNLAAGVYTVAWASLSAQDGENADGTFTFTIDPAATDDQRTPTASPTPTPTATTSPGPPSSPPPPASNDQQFPWWAVGGALAILTSGAVVGITILRGGS